MKLRDQIQAVAALEPADLSKALLEAEKKLTTLRFGFSVGKTKLSHEIKEARRQIARIKTRMNEHVRI